MIDDESWIEALRLQKFTNKLKIEAIYTDYLRKSLWKYPLTIPVQVGKSIEGDRHSRFLHFKPKLNIARKSFILRLGFI